MAWSGKFTRFGVALFSCLLLSSCSTPPAAPVVERGQPPTEKLLYHVVSTGDTLYAIAWRYELDFQRLAAANRLRPPYVLYPGQRLSLDLSAVTVSPPPRLARGGAVTATPVQQAPVLQVEPTRSVTAAPPAKVSSSPEKKPAPPPVVVNNPPPLPKGGWKWHWPARGKVSREYDTNKVLKGISIYTSSQTPVLAAAPGVVVYAGDGLRGYGKLIIVKHNDTQLSAYAHNHRILVSENQAVKQGEQIAEVGSDSSGRPRLYFEIREAGKPVDPLRRLPE